MTSNLQLVHQLTRHAHTHQEAATEAPARLQPFLLATARAADEAARLVQHNQLDQLTAKQQQMIEEIQTP